MIVCVSPSSQHYDETHNTLKYANRAKNIKTKVSRNIINVNRHVSQYVQAIYDLRQEVDSLKGRLNNSTKEAMDKIHKSNACKEASIQDGLKRLKASYEQTKEIRREKISNWQNLRIVGNRIALVKAWLSAFDEVAADLGHEEPPETLFKLRAEAEKVLRTLENNQLAIHQQDASLNWEKALELTLQNSLRSLQGIEGVQQNDATLLTSEANLLRMTGARDIYHAIADEDVDFSASINSLSKAHFQAYSVIHKIMDSSMSEPDALEAARKSLFDVMKNTGDAVALIINPTGKFLSNDIYQPGSFSSPKKKKSIGSPFRAPQGFSGIASPIKPSPRYIKAKSPKKAVKFPKKEKKRVRFQDELGDTTICEDSKRTRVVTDGMFPTIPARDDSFLHPKNDPNLGPNNHSPSTGMAVPPTRPKSRFDAGFLSKPKQPSPDPSSDVSLPTASNSPLRSFDGFDQLINRLGSQDSNDTTINESSWRALRQPGRGTMRKSIAGTGPIRPIPKRRSPSGSSQNSPEGVGQWKLGHSKRMPKGEKENGGSVTSVLSPRSTGIKVAARRMTIGGGPSSTINTLRVSSITMAGLKEVSESLLSATGAGKPTWR
jgi:kinesin family protein 18/19